MAYIQKVVNKKGEVKYKIKVSCGYDLHNNQITHTMTYTPTATTPRKIEKEVQQQAVLFEQQCRNIKNDRKRRCRIFSPTGYHGHDGAGYRPVWTGHVQQLL